MAQTPPPASPAAIDYPARVQNALRQAVAQLLRDVATDGLPGDHHFMITFDMTHPGVDVADWMREQYPEEMTIVMQHWFDNLAVMDDRFTVTLNFNNTAEPMVIPLAALKSFVDPSVEFALGFELAAPDDLGAPEDDNKSEAGFVDTDVEAAKETKDHSKEGEVIVLDAFRRP